MSVPYHLRRHPKAAIVCFICKDTFVAHPFRKMCDACREEGKRLCLIGNAKVQQALKAGRLLDPWEYNMLCAYCGERATMWEHRDYAKPLDVVPSCGRCNVKVGPGQRSNHSRYRP